MEVAEHSRGLGLDGDGFAGRRHTDRELVTLCCVQIQSEVVRALDTDHDFESRRGRRGGGSDWAHRVRSRHGVNLRLETLLGAVQEVRQFVIALILDRYLERVPVNLEL